MNRTYRIAFKVMFATDRSMALTLREKMIDEITAALPPGYMESKLYDTKESGKGYSDGYVSFGLRPHELNKHGLIGGILISGVFDTKQVRSTSPEREDSKWKAWQDAGGNPSIAGVTTTMTIYASYYHKKKGGGIDEILRTYRAGSAKFAFDQFENLLFFELADPGLTASAITSLVNSVVRDPPEGSVSKSKTVQRKVSPFSSKKKALEYLNAAGINTITKDQVMEISRWTGELPLKIIEWFRKRHFTYQ